MKLAALLLLLAGTLRATNYFVIVAGLGGEQEYESQFANWAAEMGKALQTSPAAHVETLSGPKATKQQFENLVSRIASEMQTTDSFALLMIGHGSFDGEDYKFNLPGPDLSASELAALLDRIPCKRQLVLNMTSASGASLPVLAKKNRIVITATKSGNEKNLTIFPRYFLDALRDPAADTDKNGTVSVAEAFKYAQNKTATYFENEKLLATEHSTLDDTGSKEGVRDPSPANGQGLLANSFSLIQPATETTKASASPDKQKLLARKEELETEIDRLKYQKAALAPDDYKKQLTALLLELARTQAEIDH